MFMRPSQRSLRLLCPTFVLFLTALLLPLAWMVRTASADPVTLWAGIARLASGPYLHVLANTFRIGLLVTVVCVVAGYPLAVSLALGPRPLRLAIFVVLTSSLWLSTLVRSYAWTLLLQAGGPVVALLIRLRLVNVGESLMYSLTAVVIGMTHVLLPFAVLPIWTSIRTTVDFREPAMLLGGSRTFFLLRIVLPASVTGLTSAAMLVFLMSIGFYITPALLGGGKGDSIMFSMLIEEQMNTFGDWRMGALLGGLLLAVTFAGLGAGLLIPQLRRSWSHVTNV